MRVLEKSWQRLFSKIDQKIFYNRPYYHLEDIYQGLKKKDGHLCSLWDEENNLIGLIKFKELPWDKKIFGFNCGRFEYIIFRKDVDEILKEFVIKEILKKNKDKKFIDISVDERDVDLIKILKKIGFKEMTKYFTYFIKLPIKFSNSFSVPIEIAKKENLGDLERISANSFFYTRFYQDKNFKRELVKKFYKNWIRNSFNNKKSHKIFVAQIGNKVIGFIDCKILNLFKRKIGIIDLIAVKKEYQGKGVGKSLVKKSLNYFQKKKIKEVYVETEEKNLAALRLYESLGMKIVGKRITFHLWYGKR